MVNAQSVSKPHWNVQALNIDLSGFSGITSVEVDMAASQNIAYLAFVPSNFKFEAISYNSDGTVFCRFDQTGIMERYEYDGAGRVTKVFDGGGNLLKENRYNRPQQ
jgi:YD repeat-containing protein